MAKFKHDVTLKLQTSKGGDVETVQFLAGDSVTVIKEWEHFFLVKDGNGHYYNVSKNSLES